MFVIDVIPFARTASTGALSYRSRTRVRLGTLITIPLRRQAVPGIVVACVPVREAKAAIKSAPFALRASAPQAHGIVPVAYRTAATAIAEYHATSLGSVFRKILSETIIRTGFPKRFAAGAGTHVTFIEAPYLRRLQTYRDQLVRAQGGGSVLVIAPTTIEVARLARDLGSAVVITGEISARRRGEAVIAAARAALVITTPQYAFVPIERLAHLIIERESADGYVDFKTPQIDWRIAIRALAVARNTPITYGDYPLRLDIRPTPEAPMRRARGCTIELVDMRTKNQLVGKEPVAQAAAFAAVPKPLMKALAQVVATGGRAVVCAVRRGYAPAVVCRDCGTTVRDAHHRALTLATIHGKRVLRSADGSVLRDARALCDVCGSWNLLPLGIGVERVAEEITRTLPRARVVRFDADTIRTPAAARRAAALFTTPGTVVVGTAATLPWLDPATPFSLAIIASADALLALPFWRSRERFVRLALALAERSERLFIATRRLDDTACSALTTTTLAPFFIEETALRNAFHYPPYGHVLVIRVQGDISRLDGDEARVRSMTMPHDLIRLPDRLPTRRRGRERVRTLVAKIPRDAWPNALLSECLATLPPNISITIDSESLW
ncbi:MAG: hypothetical protein B7X04_03605 [Parcubacteria group bacterium 21-54-25]|nr:MAG: hypothetical protein B7X04_03605 [Parcubacteria group bacterium 21-54-25]HQU08072.1 hypothetical protein [Candidatus Paceibacterota bacterium]